MTDNILKVNLSNLTSSQVHQLCSIIQSTDAKSPNTINELEEIIMKLKRNEVLKHLLEASEPTLGRDGRYFWRPIIGRPDIQIRTKSLEQCYEKAVDKYLALQHQFTLQESLELYNDSRIDIAESTKLRNKQLMNAWFNDILDKPISNIKQSELKDLYTARVVAKAGKIKHKDCRNINSVLRKVFEYANESLKQDTIDIEKAIKSFKDINPKLFASESPIIGVNPANRLTKDELIKVIARCNEIQNVYTCAILLAIYSGGRVSEVCGLYKSDIDFENSVINITHALKYDYSIADPKEHKSRVLPLPEKALNALRRALELSPEDSPYVFYHKAPRMDTEVLTASQLHHYLIKHIEAPLGIIPKSMHDIRRTYASLLGESPMPHALRELLLGHELVGLDKSYDVDATPVAEIIEKLNTIFADF